MPRRSHVRVGLLVTTGLLVVTMIVGISDASPPAVGHLRASSGPLSQIKPPVRDWPIPFGPKRRRQMADYSKRHYGARGWRLRRIELIVEHLTVTPSIQAVHNAFADNSPDPEFGELPGVCAHYAIGRSGRIYRLVPLTTRCRHTVGLNHISIGIEHVGRRPSDVLNNPRQLRASLRLAHWLRCRFELDVKRVIGHAESLNSPFYRELDPDFRGQTHGDWSHRAMRGYRERMRRRAACPN
jgi:N-acetylmuramoyl-L-alanine amidase